MPIRASPAAARTRIVLWVVLILSWVVLIPLLWSAFMTVPSAERLQQSRMIEIPTFATFQLIAVESAVELLVVAALLFPWRARFYLSRLWVTALGVCVWFIASTPLSLTRLAWVHRRWLAAVGVTLLLCAVVGTVARLATRKTRPGRS